MGTNTSYNSHRKSAENEELRNYIKILENQLSENEKRYKLIIDNVKEVIFQIDAAGLWMFLNPVWTDITGFSISESIGTPCLNYVHQDDRQRNQDLFASLINREKDYCCHEIRYITKDGGLRWVEVYARLTLAKDGAVIGISGSLNDITDRKLVEDLRLESEKKLRDFAQAVPDISFIYDEDGLIIEAFGNERLLARSRNEHTGFTVHQVLPKGDADHILNKIRRTIVTGLAQYEVREMEIRGTKVFFESRTAPMSYVVNGKRTVVSVVTEITERRKTEKMLQLSYELRRRSDFLNDVVNGHTVVEKRAMLFAESLGIDFMRPLCCCLLASDRFTGAGTEPNANPNDYQILKNSIIAVLSDEPDYIIWDRRDDIGVLFQPGKSAELSNESGLELACRLQEKIRCFDAQLMVTIGIGDVQTGAGSLYKSFSQAWSAVMSARCQGGNTEGIYHYHNIGIFQLLAAYGGKESAKEFVEEKIGRLLNYDREKKSDLLATLEQILQNSSLKEVAEKMFLHHKTVVFRKKRIEKILGVSFDIFETRFALAAAVKLHKLNEVM